MSLKPDFESIGNLPDDVTLTPVEVARLLGYTPAGIGNKIKKGQLKAVRVSGRWYITGKEIKNQVSFNYDVS